MSILGELIVGDCLRQTLLEMSIYCPSNIVEFGAKEKSYVGVYFGNYVCKICGTEKPNDTWPSVC